MRSGRIPPADGKWGRRTSSQMRSFCRHNSAVNDMQSRIKGTPMIIFLTCSFVPEIIAVTTGDPCALHHSNMQTPPSSVIQGYHLASALPWERSIIRLVWCPKQFLEWSFFDALFHLILALYAWRPLVINVVLHAYETQQKKTKVRPTRTS